MVKLFHAPRPRRPCPAVPARWQFAGSWAAPVHFHNFFWPWLSFSLPPHPAPSSTADSRGRAAARLADWARPAGIAPEKALTAMADER